MDRTRDELEKKLNDSNATPMSFPLEFLKAITCDFSTQLVLGEGGFGVVYKGLLRSGKIIAVKKLFEIRVQDEKFHNEVRYLMGIKHQHIVQFLGYCAESRWEAIEQPRGSGKYIVAEIPNRLLCFEYVSNKSLDTYISDESSGLEWNMRYEIIKGICSGLHFLHEGCHMVHLDLKPENILMDSTMLPKIADFGLSRIFGEQQTRLVTDNRAGTSGYMAPEYLMRGAVSNKADIFSLGVILIEILTGGRHYPYFQQDSPHCTDPSFQQFIEKVLESWRNIFVSTPRYKSVEKYIQQVKQCVTIALKCVDPGMKKRPTAKDIIEVLNTVDQMEALNTQRFSFLKIFAMRNGKGKAKELSPHDAALLIQMKWRAHLVHSFQIEAHRELLPDVQRTNKLLVQNTTSNMDHAPLSIFAMRNGKGKAKELSPHDAALLIQMKWRAHLIHSSQVLRCLRDLAVAKAKLKELRTLFNNFSYRRRITRDDEERQRFSEKIIFLLLTVDAIEGLDFMLRTSKKSMLEELEGMLKIVDAQPAG